LSPFGGVEEIVHPGSENRKHLEAMTGVTRQDYDRFTSPREIVNDEVRIAGIREPAKRLLNQRAVSEMWQRLPEEFTHLALIFRRDETLHALRRF
jgi:hypothetical protein